MLSIVSAVPAALGRQYCHILSGSARSISPPKVAMYENFVKSQVAYATPYDRLIQGPRIGGIDNTVTNLQVKGDLVVVPRINGTVYADLSKIDRGPDHEYIIDAPPADSQQAAMLNYGDCKCTRVFADTRTTWTLSAWIARGVEYNGVVGVVYASNYVTYNRVTGVCNPGSCLHGGSGIPTTTWSFGLSDEGIFPSYEQIYSHLPEILAPLWAELSLAESEFAARVAGGYVPARKRVNMTQWSGDAPAIDNYYHFIGNMVNKAKYFRLPPSYYSVNARYAIEGLNAYDSNLLAYSSDLRKIGDTVREITKLAEDVRNPKRWASAWLSGRYGDRLFVADTADLLESTYKTLKRNSYTSTGRSRISEVFTGENYTLTSELLSVIHAYNDSYNGIMTAIKNLMAWDAWPTLENTWDMIPLSFVVDWALPVQKLLGQIDAAIESPYIRPSHQYVGVKNVVETTLPEISGTHVRGNVRIVFYSRHSHSVLGDVRPFDVIAEPPSFSVTQLGDTLALVTTTRGHR